MPVDPCRLAGLQPILSHHCIHSCLIESQRDLAALCRVGYSRPLFLGKSDFLLVIVTQLQCLSSCHFNVSNGIWMTMGPLMS
jgi:hypothetical protein